MQNHIWAKTILSSYRFLDRVAGAIDKIIEKKALSHPSMLSGGQLCDSTLSLADKIISLSERKIKLINLKVLTEKALGGMEPFLANLLIKRYIEKQPVESLLSSLCIARRTYFRKIVEAESAFEWECSKLGFSNEKLDDYLQSEQWICEVKKSFEKGEPHTVSVKL